MDDTVAAVRRVTLPARRGRAIYHASMRCALRGSEPDELVVSDAAVMRRAGSRPCGACWRPEGYEAEQAVSR